MYSLNIVCGSNFTFPFPAESYETGSLPNMALPGDAAEFEEVWYPANFTVEIEPDGDTMDCTLLLKKGMDTVDEWNGPMVATEDETPLNRVKDTASARQDLDLSSGLSKLQRRDLAEVVLEYCRPCAHLDPTLEDLCIDLEQIQWAEVSVAPAAVGREAPPPAWLTKPPAEELRRPVVEATPRDELRRHSSPPSSPLREALPCQTQAETTPRERCDEPASPKDSPEDPLKAQHMRPDEAQGRVQELLQQRLQQILQRGQQERLDVAKLQELQQLLVGLGQCADTQALPQSPRWSQQSPRSPMSPSRQEPPPACPQQPSTPRPATPPSAPRHNGLPLLVPRQQDLPPRHPPHLQGPVSPAAAYGPTRQRQATPPAERPSTPSTPPRAPGRDAKVCVDELGPSVGATGEDFYPHACLELLASCLARLERFESLQDAKTAEIRPAPGEVSVSQRQGPEVPKAAGTTVAAPFPGREESAPAPAPAPSPSPPSTLKAPTTAPSPEVASPKQVEATNAGEAPTAATETVPAATAAAGGDTASGWDSDDDDDWRGTQAAGSPPQVTETPAADAAAKPEGSTSAVATPPAAAPRATETPATDAATKPEGSTSAVATPPAAPPRDEPLQEKSPSNRSTTSDRHKAAAAANAATKKVSRFSLWGSGSTKSKK
ncbi:unnamed protein product [Symbiodinium sp. KB8]|nr:unnamed protein product [Symbiodinium sp. KB8]